MTGIGMKYKDFKYKETQLRAEMLRLLKPSALTMLEKKSSFFIEIFIFFN